MTILSSLRIASQWFGLDFRRFPEQMEDFQAMKKFLESVDTVVDVGAAQGQFSLKCRNYGFSGRLLSFEPLSDSFSSLLAKTSKDARWEAWNVALSDHIGETTIHVASNNGHSSSLKPMLTTHEIAAPDIRIVGSENVAVTTLDKFFESEVPLKSLGAIALKIDAQGAEADILRGATSSLKLCASVMLELSLRPVYESSENWLDTVQYMEAQGFTLVSVRPGFTSISGDLIQLDGVFRKSS